MRSMIAGLILLSSWPAVGGRRGPGPDVCDDRCPVSGDALSGSGQVVVVWYMDAAALTGGAFIDAEGRPPGDWTLVGPR